jgi:hypothetical protein
MGIMLAEIAAYLVTNGIGTIGTDIFVAEVPDTPNLCVMLFEYAGSPSDHTLDSTRVTNPGLQVRVRGERNQYIAGREKCESVAALLDGLCNTTIGTHFYYSIFAAQEPSFLGLAENNRPEWVQNFRVSRGT